MPEQHVMGYTATGLRCPATPDAGLNTHRPGNARGHGYTLLYAQMVYRGEKGYSVSKYPAMCTGSRVMPRASMSLIRALGPFNSPPMMTPACT